MRFIAFCIVATAFCLAASDVGSAQDVNVLETRADRSVLLGSRKISFSKEAVASGGISVAIDESIHFQKMDGFGASLTDSSAALFMEMPILERDRLMEEIFQPAGPLGLTLLRQPIGASDFSSQGDYSYDNSFTPDPQLTQFSVARDARMLFPLLGQALQLNPNLQLILLPWSAPAWMKDSGTMHAGKLEDRYLPSYALYLAKTIEAYAERGLPVYALALQNEPLNENQSYPTQAMSPSQEARLAAALQPILLKHGRNPILLGYEHNWDNIDFPSQLLAEAAKLQQKDAPPLFGGISFHCYAGNESAQLALLRKHPETGIWFTECSGVNRTVFADDLLWQSQHLLLGAPLNGARSMLIWNLLLDPNGSPHNGGCGDCRALFTVDLHGGRRILTRNVEYYVLAHAAPFIHPGATRIAARTSSGSVLTAAFQNLDGTFVLLALNPGPREQAMDIQWQGRHAMYSAPARSLLTFRWGNPNATILDGSYRIAMQAAGGKFLTAGKGGPQLQGDRCGDVRQNWTVHRLSSGRFEIRNIATAESLALTQKGALFSLPLDGAHVAAIALSPQPVGVCVSKGDSCEPFNDAENELHAGEIVYLLPISITCAADRKH